MAIAGRSLAPNIARRGAAGSTILNDTWEWDGQDWVEVVLPLPMRPPARQAAGFAYDSDRGLIVMYGGHPTASSAVGVPGLNDVWTFDGSQWTQLNTPSPIATTFAGFAYDSSRHVFVLAGGASTNNAHHATAQTWEARLACSTCADGDLVCDGAIGVSDLLALLGAWGVCPAAPETCFADIAPPGGDGIVDTVDLLQLLSAWGPCP